MNQSLTFFWEPPTSDGGSPILTYLLTDGVQSFSTLTRPYTVSGLSNGELYSFTLAASNIDGLGPSASFTPVRPGNPPNPPTSLSAVQTGLWANVSWSNPLYTGDTPLLGTVLTAIPLSLSNDKTKYVRQCVVPPSKTSELLYLSSLNDLSYTILVQSVNDPGYSVRTSYTNTIGGGPIVTNGLLVFLNGEGYSGSGTWFDSGPNSFHATVENGTPSYNGSNAVVLDGSTSFEFSNPGLLSTFTVSTWFKQTGNSGPAAAILAEKFTGGSFINVYLFGNFVDLGPSQSNFVGGFYNDGFYSGPICDYADGQWHNHVMTWDGTTLTTYFNNASVGSSNYSALPGSSGLNYLIGRRWDANDFVTGEIGQVILYNRALSSGEIGSNYNSFSTIFT